MLRLWIIRCVLIAICTASLMLWVGSYFWRVGVEYHGGGEPRSLLVQCGAVEYEDYYQEIAGHCRPPPRWQWEWEKASYRRYWYNYERFPHRLAGFAFHVSGDSWDVQVPLWVPALLSAVLLRLAWKRKDPHVATNAFPVERDKVVSP